MTDSFIAKRIVSLIIFIIAVLYCVIQFLNIPNYQNSDVNRFLDKLTVEQNSQENFSDSIIEIDNAGFLCLFIKSLDNKMIPYMYNKKYFTNVNLKPADIYKTYARTIRIYENTLSNISYVVWINKFNPHYYMKFILIPILMIVLIYFIVMIVFTLLGRDYAENNMEYDSTYDSRDDDTDLYDTLDMYKNDSDFVSDSSSYENEVQSDLDENDPSAEYSVLWNRNFKISDNFKENFPFIKIIRLLKISLLPEEYISKCIASASEYFEWVKPKVFISQKNDFLECTTKEKLDKNKIVIAKDGTVKGDVYIPLYPYSKTKLFGYLKFEWNKEVPFYIADILYFLKFAFSQEAKGIFANNKQNLVFKERINQMIANNSNVCVAVIEVDSKERYSYELNQDEKNILNMKVLDDITQDLTGSIVFEAFTFIYIAVRALEIDVFKKELQEFSSNKERNYFISPDRGNIAITFSIGLSDASDSNAKGLISSAENFTDVAVAQGGDQIVSE